MRPGWYGHVQDRNTVAYFDGTNWGPVTDARHLDDGLHGAVEPLLPGHPGPPAPFEGRMDAGAPKPPRARWWFWTILGGIALTVVGSALGYLESVDGCGSPFEPDTLGSSVSDAIVGATGSGAVGSAATCSLSLAHGAAVAVAFIVVGLLTTAVSIIVRAIVVTAEATRAAATPSLAVQVLDLAMLRDNGLLSPDEFQWKKTELLRRV